jgi:Protein of unknown function (DUF3999)
VIRIFAAAMLAFLAASPFAYFKYRRPLQPINSGGQHYLVIDQSIWAHARPGLGDLRLFANETPVPYKLTLESGGSQTEQKPIRVLQPATLGGKTQFVLDMAALQEYDRINLKLATKNFVAHARVEGQDDLHGAHWALLGNTTLYDLSDEKLGHNSTLQLPLSAYKYLKVTVDTLVKPGDVESASAGVTQAEKAAWQEVRAELTSRQQGRDTLLAFNLPPNSPAERLVLDIDPAQTNFRRDMEIQDGDGRPIASSEITRIHMLRSGQKVDVEQTSPDLCGKCQAPADRATLKVIIHNGDDLPLKITNAHLQQFERRIYFDAGIDAPLWIYYGDEKLYSPQYDYAKLFQKDPRAEQVSLHAEELNSAYTGRPDDRPWSERHPAVLWAAILAAVAVLGGIAVRSLKTSVKPIE